MIDRGHQVQGLGRFFVSAFESLTVNRNIAGQTALGRGYELGEDLIEKLGLDVLQHPVEDIIAGGLKTACSFRFFQERKARSWASPEVTGARLRNSLRLCLPQRVPSTDGTY